MSKTYVFGDIHGCREPLLELLDKVNPDPYDDTLVFLGDYIDRGPDSKGVIDHLLHLSATFKKVITLKGNHEEVFLNYLNGKDINFFLGIGGEQTLQSYGIDFFSPPSKHNFPQDHLDFLLNLLPYWEDDNNIYVHAGLQPGVHLSQQSTRWLLWADGSQFFKQDHNFGKRVILGHTVQGKPLITQNSIAIDCGAVYGGALTCLILPDEDFVEVKAEKYWPPPRQDM